MRLEKFSKILVVNPYGIGDVLFTTPLIKKIRCEFPNCYLACLLGSRTREILEENLLVDEIFVFDKGKFDESPFRKRLKMLFSLLRNLRKRYFDLMFDVSNAVEYSFLAKFFLGIKIRVGFDYRDRGRFLTHKLKLTGYHDKHIVEYYLDLARLLGLEMANINKEIDLCLSKKDIEFGRRFFEEKGYSNQEEFLGVIPGGGRSWGEDAVYKHWPRERFAWVANQTYKQLGLKTLIIGGPDEVDLCQELEQLINHNCLNACSQSSLRQSSALMARCRVVLCNDSGPLHMAISQGVKTVSIFGPVDERVYGPYPPSEKHKVLTASVDCRPCYRNFKFKKCHKQKCLLEINPEEVFRAIKAHLT
jgi:heptosyltransferase-2